MSDMVERVARGVYAALLKAQRDGLMSEADIVFNAYEDASEGWESLARAAIAAMREPTKAMLLAVCDPRNLAGQKCYADDWRAMIDAALGDQPR